MKTRKLLLAVKALIEGTSRATLGQVVVEDHGDAIHVVPTSRSDFGAIELCGLIQSPLSGYFTIEDDKVVLRIF